MAPLTSMDKYLRVRPMKVMACLCGFVSLILLIIAIATTAWLESDGYRQGLWEECKIGENDTLLCETNSYNESTNGHVATDAPDISDSNITTPVPPTQATDGEQQPSTTDATNTVAVVTGQAKARAKRFLGDGKGIRDWLLGCASLCIVGLILSAIASVLCAIGLSSTSYRHKFKFYKAAMYFFVFAALVLVISLIVFPVMFLQEVHTLGRSQWFFGWAYGVAWGATVFIIGAALLLIIDKDTEEIFYSEKTYYPETETEA